MPYVSWKGDITQNQFNVAVPTNKRPAINGPALPGTTPHANKRSAQPIKHWRKQLDPEGQSGRSKASVANLIDRPGGSSRLAQSSDECKNCDANGNALFAKEYIHLDAPFITNSGTKDDPLCGACNPERNIIKSASTIINKNYYTDTNGYLKSRGKTYDQKQSFAKITGNNYGTSSDPAFPNDATNGPQVFNMLDCVDKCVTNENPNGKQTTIYKPNNRGFSQQGAVSSSNRLAKLKYDTITKNGNSLRSAFGREGANAGKYSSHTESPYFLKSKIQSSCVRFNLGGHRSICPNP